MKSLAVAAVSDRRSFVSGCTGAQRAPLQPMHQVQKHSAAEPQLEIPNSRHVFRRAISVKEIDRANGVVYAPDCIL